MSEVSHSIFVASEKSCRVEIQAYAKVNLYLEILGKRDDGYHDISSIVVPILLHDIVCLEAVTDGVDATWENGKGADLSLSCSEDNLATRAAVALKDVTGYSGGVKIHLKKKIPVGGGLGGGSADAAAVLLGLNKLWGVDLSLAKLMDIGATLGCDVPAFVHGGIVLMEGLGEKVSALKVSEPAGGWWLVMVNPGFCVSTKDIYSRCRSSLTSEAIPLKSMVSALQTGNFDAIVRSLFNGLQATVFRKYPLIEMMADGLKDVGASGVLLSGSGASLFGLAKDEADARVIAERFNDELEFEAWCDVTRMLPDGVMVAHGPLEA